MTLNQLRMLVILCAVLSLVCSATSCAMRCNKTPDTPKLINPNKKQLDSQLQEFESFRRVTEDKLIQGKVLLYGKDNNCTLYISSPKDGLVSVCVGVDSLVIHHNHRPTLDIRSEFKGRELYEYLQQIPPNPLVTLAVRRTLAVEILLLTPETED